MRTKKTDKRDTLELMEVTFKRVVTPIYLCIELNRDTVIHLTCDSNHKKFLFNYVFYKDFHVRFIFYGVLSYTTGPRLLSTTSMTKTRLIHFVPRCTNGLGFVSPPTPLSLGKPFTRETHFSHWSHLSRGSYLFQGI